MLPAVVFSIGRTARSASPARSAATASAKLRWPLELALQPAPGEIGLGRDVAVRPGRTLKRDADRRAAALEAGDVGGLPQQPVRDDVLEHLPHEHGGDPRFAGLRFRAREQLVLAVAVADRLEAGALRARDAVHQREPSREDFYQIAVGAVDRAPQVVEAIEAVVGYLRFLSLGVLRHGASLAAGPLRRRKPPGRGGFRVGLPVGTLSRGGPPARTR